jgi:hypothetical protein
LDAVVPLAETAAVAFALGVTLCSWALLRWLRRRDTRTLAWLGRRELSLLLRLTY